MTFRVKIPSTEDVRKVAKLTLRILGEETTVVMRHAFPKGMKSGRCPFCGLSIGVDWEGTLSSQGHPGLYHALPMCETYDSKTADEYVEAVLARGRDAYGRKR